MTPHTEMILVCAGRSPGVPCLVRAQNPGACLCCEHLRTLDRKKLPPGWLDEALNEGDDSYVP